MSAATKIAAALVKHGRSMTLRRRSGTTSTFTDVTVYGVAAAYQPTELVGGVKQGDMRVTISDSEIAAASWDGPPRQGDLIVIDGKTYGIQGADSRYLSSTVLAHVLHVRGG